MKILSGQHFLMMGDSITDAGRIRPVDGGISEGFDNQLGEGYARIVCGLLNAVYPERLIRVTNAGISGDNVLKLKARWQRDCLDCTPDWVSVMIGVNDTWSCFSLPQNPIGHVPLPEYEKILEDLVKNTLPRLSGGMILMTPYLIESNRSDAMRIQVEKYGKSSSVWLKNTILYWWIRRRYLIIFSTSVTTGIWLRTGSTRI